MNNAVTYTNGVSTVTFTYDADAVKCILNINGKIKQVSGEEASEFEDALLEAEYFSRLS